MHAWITILCAVEKARKPKKGHVLTEREREQKPKWLEAPICQRKRGETVEEIDSKKWERDMGGWGWLWWCNCQTANSMWMYRHGLWDRQKEGEGWWRSTDTQRKQRQEEGIKDSQLERVTECSPERESVWVNVRAVLAKSSVNLNLWLTPWGPALLS